MLAFLRKCQLIALNKSTHNFNEEKIVNEDNREEAERSRYWLKNNFEPWEEVLHHWEKSFELRRSLLHDHSTYQNLSSIFDDWNILTFSQGYVLIEKDYLRLYNEKHKNVEEKFHFLFDAVLELKGKELDCSNKVLLDMLNGNIPNDSKILIKIYLLFSLLPNKSSKAKVGKNFFKPTQVESQEAVILHVKIPSDIEEEIEKKRKWLKKFNLTLQPFILIVGPSLTEIETIFVRIDNVSYKVKTLWKAVEICFMVFIILDLKYPLAAEHIWYLFQRSVFDIELHGDNKIPVICDAIKKISK
ncbi:uncharacterized protein [Linepithema humile]